MEEIQIASSPSLEELLESFRRSNALVPVVLNSGDTQQHIQVGVHWIGWVDPEERRQLEFRGLTSTGRRYRASVDYDRPYRSGVVLDPDD